MVKYSILVPVYNAQDHLNKCIDSLLTQKNINDEWEIILVDDGSTDSSGEICDDYSEKNHNVRCVHKKNQGPHIARGAGVKEAQGEYLLFVDSDDYVENDYLTTIDEYIREYEPDCLAFGYIKESGSKCQNYYVTNKDFEIVDQKEVIKQLLCSDSYNSVWSKAVKADLIKNYLDEIYKNCLRVGEDKLQMIYVIRGANKIVHINKCLYHYVYNDSSIVHDKRIKDIEDDIQANSIVQTIGNEILDELTTSSSLKEKLSAEHLTNSYNRILDHIYKYDKRKDLSFEEKICDIRKLISEYKDFFFDKKINGLSLKKHNILRFYLLRGMKIGTLIRLDEIISMVHKNPLS